MVCTHLGSFLQQRGHQGGVLAARPPLRASGGGGVSLQHRSMFHKAMNLLVHGIIIYVIFVLKSKFLIIEMLLDMLIICLIAHSVSLH